MKTIFKIGSKSHTLKYQRKMSEGEVKKMKSFVTSKGVKIEKTGKFKIIEFFICDQKNSIKGHTKLEFISYLFYIKI